jgi:hypothetical protein
MEETTDEKDLKLLGMYVVGAQGCQKSCFLSQLVVLQDNLTNITLLIRDPRGQPIEILLDKEEADDATKMDNDSTQPEA